VRLWVSTTYPAGANLTPGPAARSAAKLPDRHDRLSADCDEYRRRGSWTLGLMSPVLMVRPATDNGTRKSSSLQVGNAVYPTLSVGPILRALIPGCSVTGDQVVPGSRFGFRAM
jgi:hypothetical protein